jgi:hypothetical protein
VAGAYRYAAAKDRQMDAQELIERLEESFFTISQIADQRGMEPPTTVVMNLKAFEIWYYHCQELGISYTHWNDLQIIIEKNSPALFAWTYHPPQQ